MPNSMFVRYEQPPYHELPNPHPLQTFDVQVDEVGNRVATPVEPVAPSYMEDFDVISNAMRQNVSPIQERTSADIVDVEKVLANMIV